MNTMRASQVMPGACCHRGPARNSPGARAAPSFRGSHHQEQMAPRCTRRASRVSRASPRRHIASMAGSGTGWADFGDGKYVIRTVAPETPVDKDDTSEWAKRFEGLLPHKDSEDPRCDGDMCEISVKAKGSVMGAALLIAGCSLGGGMLAVPAAAIGAGFAPTMAAMVGVWVFLLMQGMLLVEVNIAAATWLKRRDASILDMARLTLGKSVGTIVAIAYVLLSNATLISQMIRGGSILDGIVPGLSYVAATILVAAVGGGLVYFTTAEGLDEANQRLVAVMVVSFVGLLMSGVSSAVWMRLGRTDWALSAHMTPTMLQVLQYGNLIPVVCTYLNLDKERIKKALVIGSAIPMVMVGLWSGLSFAMTPFVQGSVPGDPTDLLIHGGGGVLVSAMVTVFAGAAVLTTIIGMLLSLHEFWEGALRSCAEDEEDSSSAPGISNGRAADSPSRTAEVPKAPSSLAVAGWRHRGMMELMSRVISMVPALLISITVSEDAFHEVLSFSGAYLVTILCGLVPPLMAWVTRGNKLPWTKPWAGPSSRPMLPGGRWLLSSLFSLTVVFIAASIVQDAPLFLRLVVPVSA